ncbi:trithorax group protein osa [Bactrocera dorsalis]|uniref:Trithorax group protein osa n=1 Tax=Bactrocera dorsalis TaxID=27457 RepID=A0A6I9VHB0_BACDO|nr:trithorax group protein osa [Bactrocera dorsalis]
MSSIIKAAEETTTESDGTTEPPSKGKSFFLFGGFFQKIRQRWSGQPDPSAPIYAGPVYPFLGSQNCPAYGGCNPAWSYRPVPYEVHNIYYTNAQVPPLVSPYPSTPVQPQQQQQQNQQSNLVILHTAAGSQISAYPQPKPYPAYPQFVPQQSHVPSTIPTGGQPHHSAYVPNNYGDYPPVIYGTQPPPSYGPITPNYLPNNGGVAYHRPDTAISVATSGGSAPCNPRLYACNIG